MKCSKCGAEIVEGDIFCTGCGMPLGKTNNAAIYQDPTSRIDEKKKANNLCILSLLLYFASPIVLTMLDIFFSIIIKEATVVFSLLILMARIAGIVIMVVARIKYPNSTFAKVLMWIYIGLFIAGFLFFLIIMIIILSLGIALFS